MSRVPSAPIHDPSGTLAPRPSSWPMVIGVIAIVFGALGLMGGCLNAVILPFMGSLAEALPEQIRHMFGGIAEWGSWLAVLAVAAAAVAALLLVAGIGLVRRRSFSAKLCLTWAFLKIGLVVVNSLVGYMAQQVQFEAMADDPNMAAVPGGLLTAMGVLGAVLTLLWGCALPVFMLAWFLRGTIQAEVGSWDAFDDEAAFTAGPGAAGP